MASAKKISIIAASAAGALATAGSVVYVLVRHAPARRAIRESEGWTPATRHLVDNNMTDPTKRSTTPTAEVATPMTSGPTAKPIKSADPNPKPGIVGAIKEVVLEFINDDVMTQAAALAFYTGLALAPLMTLIVWAAQVFLPSNKKYDILKTMGDVMGQKAAAPLQDLISPATQKASAGLTIAGIVSIGLVAFSASGVFGQVQSALNSIWHVQARPSNGIIGFIKKRVLSLGMLLSILFLLLTSVVLSTTLQGWIEIRGETETSALMSVVNNVVTVGLFTVLFAMMFKFVPDAKIGWKPVWVGGLLSAVMFAVGKFGLAYYLGRSDYDSSYGTAFGSFVALLVWVYYSAVIILMGAEATEVYARRQGHALEPDEHAVRVIQTTDPA